MELVKYEGETNVQSKYNKYAEVKESNKTKIETR